MKEEEGEEEEVRVKKQLDEPKNGLVDRLVGERSQRENHQMQAYRQPRAATQWDQ